MNILGTPVTDVNSVLFFVTAFKTSHQVLACRIFSCSEVTPAYEAVDNDIRPGDYRLLVLDWLYKYEAINGFYKYDTEAE